MCTFVYLYVKSKTHCFEKLLYISSRKSGTFIFFLSGSERLTGTATISKREGWGLANVQLQIQM